MDGNIGTVKGVAVLVVRAESAGPGQLIHVVPKIIIDADNHAGGVPDDFFASEGHKLPLGKRGELHFVMAFREYIFFGIVVVCCPAAHDDLRNVFMTPPSGPYFCVWFAQDIPPWPHG